MQALLPPTLCLALLLSACGGGGGGGDAAGGSPPPLASVAGPGAPGTDDQSRQPDVVPAIEPGIEPDLEPGDGRLDDPDADELDPDSPSVRYRVTLENFWSAEDYPQEFPDDAHLSLIGGALHDERVEFWALGEPLGRGMQDMAETGRIDILLLDEVVPEIERNRASAMIEYRIYTDPMVDGAPGSSSFDIQANAAWPLLTLATMLGPSPDWFVGVSGLALNDESGWRERIVVDLPLLDGGSKSEIIPLMGGPDITPPEPVGYVAYDPATGTYLPSERPETIARLTIERLQ